MTFSNREHFDFYTRTVERLNADCYLASLIYTIGIDEDTRNHWNDFYDEEERSIKLEVLQEGWQTSGSMKITRLAFQLFTDNTPTAISFDKNDNLQENFAECKQYSVSDIFCCEYAPFFVEAIKLRYADYFSPRPLYKAEFSCSK